MTPLYLYETLHVHRGRPRLLTEHLAALDAASQVLFGRTYRPDVHWLTECIATLIRTERYPAGVSVFVRLELTTDTQRLTPAGASLYNGYALRALTPTAAVVEYDLPPLPVRSSAHEQAATLANLYARHAGADLALRCTSNGVLTEADAAPLFAIRGRELYAPPQPQSVMCDLVLRASAAVGLAAATRPVLRDELSSYDELFYADHRGITALSRCNDNPYTSLVAERIAYTAEDLSR